MKNVFNTLSELAAFLLVGTFLALVWANLDYESYHALVDGTIFTSAILNHAPGNKISLHFLVNDIFMVLFFGIAMKEVSESFLPGGALSSVKKAAMPAIATAGGVFGPIAAFFLLHMAMGPEPGFMGAWAIPTATDIAYCWLFAGLIFGRAHPAVTFLLVLAVLDDLVGMLIIAVFYTPEVHLQWLGLVVLAIIVCEIFRRMGVKSFWPYILVGAPLAWFGLHNTGVHAALALVPVIPFMPHAERDAGLFTDDGDHGDTMNNFEHFFKPIVDVGLFFFGFANAGVILSGDAFMGKATWIILLSLLVGKTVGITLFSWVANKMGLDFPEHMSLKHVIVVGSVAGIGFTVALFVTTVALGSGKIPQEVGGMLKLGALLSFSAGAIGIVLAKIFKIEKIHPDKDAETGHGH